MPSPPDYLQHALRKFIHEGPAFLLAVSLTLLCQWGIADRVDVGFFDEGYYLLNSQPTLPERNDVFWAPFYQLYLFVFSRMSPNLCWAYLANFSATAFFAAVGAYAGLRLIGLTRLVCVLAALYLASWEWVWFAFPRVNHFTGGLLLLGTGASLAMARRNALDGRILFFATMLAAAWCRPELLWCAALALAFLLWEAWKRYKTDETVPRKLGIVFGIAVALFVIWDRPGGASQGRQNMAFTQHYAVSYYRRYPERAITQPKTDVALYTDAFGEANTILGAAQANGAAFREHIAFNAGLTFAFLKFTPLARLFPQDVLGGRAFVFGVFGLALVVFGSMLIRIGPAFRRLRAVLVGQAAQGDILLVLALAMFVELAMCVVLFPRQHYILLFFFLLILVVAVVMRPAFGQSSPWVRAIAGGLCAYFIVVCPKVYQWQDSEEQPVRRLIAALSKVEQEGDLFFAGNSVLAMYLPQRAQVVDILDHVGPGLPSRPGLILTGPRMGGNVKIPAELRGSMRLVGAVGKDSAWAVLVNNEK